MANTTLTPQTAKAEPDRISGALKNALGGALIALVLAVPILSHQTAENLTSLKINQRWVLTAVVVGLVFVVRFLMQLFWWSRPEQAAKSAPGFADGLSGALKSIGPYVAPLLVAFAIALPFLPFTDRYIVNTGIQIMTYVMLGWGLNIVVGLAGLLDLGYVAFYAVGAYTFAILSTMVAPALISAGFVGPGIAPWLFWICLPLAGLLAAVWGVILGFPVLRLRGDYLAIVTLAFGEIIRVVLENFTSLTRGPKGIGDIPRPSLFGIEFKSGPGGFADVFGFTYAPIQRVIFLYFVILALALITNLVTLRLRRLPIGRAWEALREDEIACRSLGINTTNTKLTAFAIGAMFGGFAGAFFATNQNFISPESFNFNESATILAIVVLGGLGSQVGVALASVVMIGGIEVLRNLNFLKSEWIFGHTFDPSQYRMLLFGIALVAIMIWKPRGIISGRTPTVLLNKKTGGAKISGDLVKEGAG